MERVSVDEPFHRRQRRSAIAASLRRRTAAPDTTPFPQSDYDAFIPAYAVHHSDVERSLWLQTI